MLAVFDLEGTVLPSSLLTQYLSIMRFIRPLGQFPSELVDLIGKTNVYLKAERRDLLLDTYRAIAPDVE